MNKQLQLIRRSYLALDKCLDILTRMDDQDELVEEIKELVEELEEASQ